MSVLACIHFSIYLLLVVDVRVLEWHCYAGVDQSRRKEKLNSAYPPPSEPLQIVNTKQMRG